MRRAAVVVVGIVLLALGLTGYPTPGAAAPPAPRAGAAGVGDPYFPLDGNGGYDVRHYDLRVDYRPATDRLRGTATITARATQRLSRFDLDLQGLEVEGIEVDGRAATWTRQDQELVITPARPLGEGRTFTVVVRYQGVPVQVEETSLGAGGVFPTTDGAVVIGQPHVAATWFPVNDHPRDKATYRVVVTVPRGLEAVSNGRLVSTRHRGGSSTWTWVMAKPMASYLATATVGEFDLTSYREDGLRFLDAIDPVLFETAEPRTGSRYAASGADDSGYKRLTRTIAVPAAGGRLSFWVDRATEGDWDFFLVEARPVGTDRWTTLPDLNGHTTTSTGASCPAWLALHPFLAHYQSADGEDGCTPTGTTGSWNAASGSSAGYEEWALDLAAYAGQSVELALAVVSDDQVSVPAGVYVDDVTVPGGAGSTSFEADGDPLDGWSVTGPPAGSPGNASDWRLASEAVAPSTGELAEAALAREPEVLRFLSGIFGRYPFRDAGGIVDNDPDLGFALENQTRPIYSNVFFDGSAGDTSVVVHELAHQWVGDSLTIDQWRHIWLNEGFATYAEWLWSEEEGNETADEIFAGWAALPTDHPVWATAIGDPGPDHLFDGQVYIRGAMTLHALRTRIGDDDFFTLLRRWTTSQRYGHVSTAEFQALAERLSGQDLDAFFQAWLFAGTKPAGLPAGPAASRTARSAAPVPARQKELLVASRR